MRASPANSGSGESGSGESGSGDLHSDAIQHASD
jgi:hypothetical protein